MPFGIDVKGKVQALFTMEPRISCHRFVKYLPDTEFVVNNLDEPRSLPGETEDIDKRYASKQCENASETFRLYRHLHGTINNRRVCSPDGFKISSHPTAYSIVG